MSNHVYGYVRVSGASQVEKDGPVRQQLAITEFCKNNGFPEPVFYSDLGVSGTVEGLDRPGFLRMLDEALQGGTTIIIVETMNRLARDLIVSELMMRELRARGLSLYAADQGKTDLTTADDDPSRKLIRQVLSAVSEYEKSALVLKLRAARQRKKLETGRCGGKLPYGREGKDRAEMMLIQLVINLRHSGVSWRGVAALLNQDKVKKRNGKTEWTVSEVFEAFAHRIPEAVPVQTQNYIK